MDSDIARTNSAIQDLEFELERTRREGSNLQAQIVAITGHIAEIKTQDRIRDEDMRKADAAEETVSDNRRRQDRLRELIADERLKMQIAAKLEAKKAEMVRVTELASRGFATKTQVQTVKAEVGVLEAQVKETEKITTYKEELTKIDKVIVPKPAVKNQGSTAIEQIVFKKLELELLRTANQKGIEQIGAALAAKKAEVGRMMGLQQQHRSLIRAVDACESERHAAAADFMAMKKLQAIKTFEFSIVTPAEPSPYPATSNKKLLVLAVSSVGMLLTLGFLAFNDLVLRPRVDKVEVVGRLALPVLSRLPASRGLPLTAIARPDFLDEPAVRLLALRLRQAVPDPGSLVLFSSMNVAGGSAELAASLARCFARRDERVLILDAAGHEADGAAWQALRAPGSSPGTTPPTPGASRRSWPSRPTTPRTSSPRPRSWASITCPPEGPWRGPSCWPPTG